MAYIPTQAELDEGRKNLLTDRFQPVLEACRREIVAALRKEFTTQLTHKPEAARTDLAKVPEFDQLFAGAKYVIIDFLSREFSSRFDVRIYAWEVRLARKS